MSTDPRPTVACPICGAPLPDTTGKRGRPRIYCSDRCKAIDHTLRWVDEMLSGDKASSDAAFTATPAAAKRLRSRIWGIANGLNDRTRPRPVAA